MSNERESTTHSLMDHLFKNRYVHSPNPVESHRSSCMCTENDKSIAGSLLNRSGREKLIAYIRVLTNDEVTDKLELIQAYCLKNGYKITDVFTDICDHPSFGFKAALDAMEHTDGLISFDLNMFVREDGDRMRELRPFIHHFFCIGGKHLITIADGIDTGTLQGQESAIEAISQVKDGFET